MREWETRRVKTFLTETKETVGEKHTDYTLLSLTKAGVIIRNMDGGGKFPSNFGTYKIVESGQIIFCLFDVDETPRTVGLSKHNGMITGAYDIFNIQHINPNFFEYYFLSVDNVKGLRPLYTGLRKVVSKDTFLQIKIPLPPRDEQDQIVRYLDWKVSQINKLISAKRRQIALLGEQNRVFINQTLMTRRDTWHTYRAKYLFLERNERSEHGEETHLSMSQKYGLVSDEQLDERRMLSESYQGGKVCYKDDVVLNRLKAHLGVFALAPQKGVISPDYTVLQSVASKILPKYAEYFLKSDTCRHELRIRVRGVVEGFWRLYTEDFNTIAIPTPSLEEQTNLLTQFNKVSEHIVKIINKLNEDITLLTEYRTRLISDVVTGRLDVRGVNVPEYEAVDDVTGDENAEDIADTEEMEGE